ncbi:MAG: murein biosynthesis integral membrane protein MurJ, partial [Pseudomonadota bacterium]
FSGGTFVSRITGLIRDITAAAFFTSSENDIWVVAFRIPNLLRGILAEGTTNMAVVPVLTDALKENREKAKRVSNSIFTAFLIILSVVTILGIILTPQIVGIMVPDFVNIPGKMQTTIELTRIMFPYILLIGLTAFCMGSLNSIGHFFASSIHPAFLNMSLIVFAYMSYLFEPRVKAIAFAVIVGGLLQFLFHVPYLKKYDFMPRITFKFEVKELIKTWKLFAPSLLSISVVPITVMMNTYFASIVGPGSISHFFWSDRLVQFPIGIFAVSLGTAILPILSRSSDNMEKLKSNYSYAFKICTFFLLPATAGLMAISLPLVKVGFKHGNFNWADTVSTAGSLFYLMLSLYPSGIIRITVPLFYSVKDSLRPAIFSLLGLAVNVTICFLTVRHFGIRGISFAVAAASLLNASLLLAYFSTKYSKLRPTDLTFFLKMTVVSALTFISAYSIVKTRDWSLDAPILTDAFYLFAAIAAGTFMFLASSYVLKVRKDIQKP